MLHLAPVAALLVAAAVLLASARACAEDQNAVETAGRTTLTAAEARELVEQHEGPLDLSGLRDLDPEVAVILGSYRDDLLLDGLTTLSAEAAAALAAGAGDAAAQVDPHAIAARVAEAFESGDLDGERIAQIIGEFGGEADMRHLSLGGLTSLDADVAAALAGHLGTLSLDGLEAMGVESARALAGHVGSLSMAGLESGAPLPAEVVDALAAHVGEILIPDEVLAAISSPAAEPAASVPPGTTTPETTPQQDAPRP